MSQTVDSDQWATPRRVIETLEQPLDGFDVDPASGAEDEPIAPTRYTVEDDGLAQSWHGDVWLNPPYSDPGPWLEKAREEIEEGDAEIVVALIKGDTSTSWYHRHAVEADFTCFVDGRLKFEGASSQAAFPSHILVYYDDDAVEWSGSRLGDLLARLDMLGKIRRIGF